MDRTNIWRRLRGAIGNAVVWGGAWAASAMVMFGVLRVTGVLSQGNVGDALFVAARFSVVGAIASVAFSGVVRLLYRGRRLWEISWLRFGVGGAVVGGVFVTAVIVANRILSGEPMLPLANLLTNGVMAAAFGGIAAAGSLRLAQRAEALIPGRSDDRLAGLPEVDQLIAGDPAAEPVNQRSRSAT